MVMVLVEGLYLTNNGSNDADDLYLIIYCETR